jgi:hypothetical protein
MIKSRRIRWAWRGAYRIWWGDLRKRNNFEDLGVDGMILKWISNKWDGDA